MHQTLNEGEGYFVHTPEDRLYLTGFTGSDGWVVVADTTFLLVDSRYYIQAENQSFPLLK